MPDGCATSGNTVVLMAETRGVTVVLADPVGVARAALRRLVEATWGWTVVAEASDGFDAVRAARTERPDVLLVDAAIGGIGVSDIRRTLADTSTLVVALLERPEQHAGQQGPSALKSVPSEALQSLIMGHLRRRWMEAAELSPDPADVPSAATVSS